MADDVSEIIRLARVRKGWNKAELARRVGVARQTVGDWENSRSAPTRKRAPKVAEVLDIPLASISGDPETANVAFLEHSQLNKRRVPMLDWANAGLGEETVAQLPRGNPLDSVEVAFLVSNRAFALEVRGNSMEPDFMDGDVIVVDPATHPHSGDFVVAELLSHDDDEENGRYTFKQYKPRGAVRGEITFDLVPLNPAYPTRTVNPNSPGRLVGTVVEHHRRLRR